MQVLGCESGLSLNEQGQPICGSGWVSIDPATLATPPLTPEETTELWGYALMALSFAALVKILKQQFFFG